MTLVLKPCGRGNWSLLRVRVEGSRAPPPYTVAIGERMQLFGVWFRVCKIEA